MGTLAGTVSDSTGAKIAHATVTAIDTVTNFSTTAVTQDDGTYSIQFLQPDNYTISISAVGFKSQNRTGVLVTADASLAIDFVLTVGSQNQTVTVQATNAEILDRNSADLSVTLTAQEVTDLPVIGRDPYQVASITPGMYDSAFMQSKAVTGQGPGGNSGSAIIASGVGGSHTVLLLNGTYNAPRERISGTGGGYGGFAPSPESVQEVKIQTSMYDGEYGNSGGAAINTVLRPGSNDYHGAAFYIMRNTYLNANTYERVPNQNGATNPASPTPRINGTWSNPGFVLAGPVRIPRLYNGRDKTFFMVAYERFQLHGSNTSGSTDLVPDAAMASGDFSELCTGGFDSNGVCVSGGGVQIYDPLTYDASYNRTPFQYNKIPANRISPVGAAILKLYPKANSTVKSGQNYNYISATPLYYQKQYQFVARADQSINDNNKFNAFFYHSIMDQYWSNQGYPTAIAPTGTGHTVWRNMWGGGMEYISMLPRNYILDARFGVMYHPFGLVYAGNSYDLAGIGMSTNGIYYNSFPGISMSDSYGGFQAGSSGQLSSDTGITANAVVSKLVGKHSLRFGVQSYLERYNAMNPMSGLGTFNFSRQFTQQNSHDIATGGDPNSGNPVASLLLGYPTSGSYAYDVSFATQYPWYGFFLQDDWRTSSKLTLNLGLRWENQMPLTERFNRLNTGFCTTCTNPLQSQVSGLTLPGGLEFASSSNRNFLPPDLKDWQPRFGASYSLSPHIVLHGGAGLTYVNSMESPIGQGWTTSTSYVATNDNTTPAGSLSNLYPNGTIATSGGSLGLATMVGQNLSFPTAENYVRPKLWQWSASTQVALKGNTTVQIAYVGNREYDLEISGRNINALPAQYNLGTYANQTALQVKVNNPMKGLISTNSTLNASTIQQQYLLYPFPEFGTLSEQYIPTGGSEYNGLQIAALKAMSRGFSIFGGFTWTHQVGMYQYKNPWDTVPERFLDPQPNLLFNLAAIYQLPRLENEPRLVRGVAGGWQANMVFRAYNGARVGIPSGYTELADPSIAHHNHLKEFNTCYEAQDTSTGGWKKVVTGTGTSGSGIQYTTAPACSSTSDTPVFRQDWSYTLVTSEAYMKNIRARAGQRTDASIFKVFPIHEGMTFEIRGEFFNLTNTAIFSNPTTTPGNAAYGQLSTTQQNDPRLTQLTARINF